MSNLITLPTPGHVAHKNIEAAFKKYMAGEIGPWDLQEVVEDAGFGGWTGTSDGKLIVHTKEYTYRNTPCS